MVPTWKVGWDLSPIRIRLQWFLKAISCGKLSCHVGIYFIPSDSDHQSDDPLKHSQFNLRHEKQNIFICSTEFSGTCFSHHNHQWVSIFARSLCCESALFAWDESNPPPSIKSIFALNIFFIASIPPIHFFGEHNISITSRKHHFTAMPSNNESALSSNHQVFTSKWH